MDPPSHLCPTMLHSVERGQVLHSADRSTKKSPRFLVGFLIKDRQRLTLPSRSHRDSTISTNNSSSLVPAPVPDSFLPVVVSRQAFCTPTWILRVTFAL